MARGDVLLRNTGRSKWLFYLKLDEDEAKVADKAGFELRPDGRHRIVLGDHADYQREGWPQPEAKIPSVLWKKLLDDAKQGPVIEALLESTEFVQYAT